MVCILTVILCIGGCGKKDGGPVVTSGSGSSFYSAAANVIPAIPPTSKADKGKAFTWGNPMYELYQLLREYIDARDAGSVGLPNIHKVLYQVSSFYDEASSSVLRSWKKSSRAYPSPVNSRTLSSGTTPSPLCSPY
jgi:hypothetical protein